MRSKKKVKRLSQDEMQQRRIQAALSRKIKNVFTGAGFIYIPTKNHHMDIGLRTVEIDALFVYENVFLLCEDTIEKTNIKDHIRTKNEAIGEIKAHLLDFINRLCVIFPDVSELLRRYDVRKIIVFGLYFSLYDMDLNENDHLRFTHLMLIQPQTLDYFQWIVQCIKCSARNEIFRFLNLKSSQIGHAKSASSNSEIDAPIIYPREFTGLKNNVRVISFMMSAEDLMNTCYVLRKDDWEESIWLYQRLIDKNKIRKIRSFLEMKEEAFYNNIIVALPDNAMIIDASGHQCDLETIDSLDQNCRLMLQKEINSVCIIDGQHRIYAYYKLYPVKRTRERVTFEPTSPVYGR